MQDINDHIKKLGIDSLASDAKEASHGKADSKGDSKPEVTGKQEERQNGLCEWGLETNTNYIDPK